MIKRWAFPVFVLFCSTAVMSVIVFCTYIAQKAWVTAQGLELAAYLLISAAVSIWVSHQTFFCLIKLSKINNDIQELDSAIRRRQQRALRD